MIWARLGGGFMAVAVALGAFGAHALKTRLTPEMHAVFEVGVRYHVYHSLALFAVAWLGTQRVTPFVNAAGACFSVGILFFSGALYLYAVTGVSRLAMFAPLGGALFIAGWILVWLAAAPRPEFPL